MQRAVPIRVQLGAFEFDLKAGELRQGAIQVRLQEQPFQVLRMLVDASGEVVTREEIRKKLWPNDTVVEFDQSIRTAINKLRRALGDAGDSPRYVESVGRRGYRLLVAVECLESSSGDPTPTTSASSGQALSPEAGEKGGAPLIGSTVSHYRVLEIIGGGGMGMVYKAEDLKLGRPVALKFLPEELAGDPLSLQRFEREARTASSLNHANICHIYEFGEHEGQPFIAMELLAGETLRDRLAAVADSAQTLPDELLRIGLQVCDGLEAAHEKGVIHRDVKPANIFLTNKGVVKILDFGLAKLVVGEEPTGTSIDLSSRAQVAAAATGVEGPVVSSPRDTADPSTSCPPGREDAAGKEGGHSARDDNSKVNGAAEAEPLPPATPIEHTLTRTGVAMGTAGYMSPEQVRGEKLDARTDIFSFGLVLYEMATGQRAFTGETAAILKDAILNHTPVSVRELDPTLPARLETVISKALEKDRERRYDSAASLRGDLVALGQGVGKSASRKSWGVGLATAVIALAVVVAAVSVWVQNRQRTGELPRAVAPDVKQRQLTTNTADNPVADAYISPDGSQLAYFDRGGIHVKTLATGDIKTLPPPEAMRSKNIAWTTGPWLHDGKTLIADASGEGLPSTWAFSLLDGTSRKLRDDADTYELSPDGSRLVFTRNDTRLGAQELWAMDINGENARKLLTAGENSGFGDNVGWAPNGRITYVRLHETGQQREDILESFDPKGGAPVRILSTPVWWQKGGLMGFEWLPGGRLVYELTSGSTASGYSCNFWDMWVDERTGKPRTAPRQLTNWAGFCMQSMTATTDYKQIAYLRAFYSLSVLVADLDAAGARARDLRRLTTSESIEYPTAWTPDSKSIIFHSNRNGPTGIFLQAIGQENPKIIVMGTEDSVPMSSTVTPDGHTLIYTLVPFDQGARPSASRQVMSIPISGGTAVKLLEAQIVGSPRCAQPPSNLCAIAERSPDGKQLVFTALDTKQGRGAELLRFTIGPDEIYSWDLSPDGKHIAVAKQGGNRFDILSVDGSVTRMTILKGWKVGVDRPGAGRDPMRGADFDWAANGKGFYVASGLFRNPVLLFVDLQGNARVVHEYNSGEAPGGRGGFSGLWGIPSPDGRHLAILNWYRNRNAWMMENF